MLTTWLAGTCQGMWFLPYSRTVLKPLIVTPVLKKLDLTPTGRLEGDKIFRWSVVTEPGEESHPTSWSNIWDNTKLYIHFRFGAYMSYNYDQEHSDSIGCQYKGGGCDVNTDEVTVLNMALVVLNSVSRLSTTVSTEEMTKMVVTNVTFRFWGPESSNCRRVWKRTSDCQRLSPTKYPSREPWSTTSTVLSAIDKSARTTLRVMTLFSWR